MEEVVCKNCGKVMVGHSNNFGKICTNCGFFIEPCSDIKIVEEGKKIKEKYSLIAINKLRDILEKNGGNEDGD